VAGTRFTSYARVPELHDLVLAARASGRPLEMDVRLWAPRGRLLHASAIPFATGEVAAESGDVLLVLRDLTEVERLGRVRQDFVANVSHELRTPLTSIRGYAETLLEGGLEDDEHRIGFVETIRNNAVRLEALAADLLTLAELERPGEAVRGESFDLRALVETQAVVFRSRAHEAALSLDVEPGPALPVEADRPRIEQVLANLIDNALKYTEHGGVRLRLGQDAGRAWCEIEDSGPGVPEEDQPRIFERFYRVDKARSRAKGGTGLGLSIVKNIVSLHHGEVSVRSASPHGSVFRFEIPAHPGFLATGRRG
jgi:two-component system phosphate regulon sensor histidine kinase PhoR